MYLLKRIADFNELRMKVCKCSNHTTNVGEFACDLYIDVMVIDHQMPNTVKQAYNKVPGTAILLRYKHNSFYSSSLQHVIKSPGMNANHFAVSVISL